MAAITMGATYSPPSPLELHYAEATSSIHPDRPIRPLPKRRLRARLSSEVADSILYPPDPTLPRLQSQIPYDDPPSHLNGLSKELSNGNNSAMVAGTEAAKASYQFKGNEFGSEDEALIMRRPQDHRQRPASLTTSSSKIGYTKNDGSKFIKSPMPQSIASSNDSVDGYDSFENTNNKKKRKIPMSGSLGHHHSSLSAEMAQMGISSTRDIDSSHAEADSSVGHYYGSGSSAMPTVSSGSGISGAGRGRYGRAGLKHHGGRSPLGVSVNGSNTLQASRALYHRRDNANVGGAESKGLASTQSPDQGIISAAIANAAALPAKPVRGQENASLFEHESLKKPASSKTQFTFTCESNSAKSMVWPDVQSPLSRWDKDMANAPKARAQNGRGFTTQGKPSNPNVAVKAGEPAPQHPGVIEQASQQPRNPRRQLDKQYRIAARDRRLRQEYSNYHHPPKNEDIWICQFCEYESIFGEKPQYLIRQYEAKDRRERKRIAEKRRLLEKAKMKGRKGKKGNKNSKNSTSTTQQQQQYQKQLYDNQLPDDASLPHHSTQSEEYGPDEYEEAPSPLPMLQQTPSKIPQPIGQNQTHSLRPPSGSIVPRQGAVTDRDTYF